MRWLKPPYLYWEIGLLVIIGGIAYLSWGRPAPSPYETAPAGLRDLTQMVSVTGKVKPLQSVDLSFPISGTISAVNAEVGQHVAAGETIETLDRGALAAKLAQAKANLDTQQAKLQGLLEGTRPQDIQVAEAEAAKAAQDLANMYASAAPTLADAYAKANDAVHYQLNSFFSNPDSSSPQLTFSSTDSQDAINAQSERVAVGAALSQWQTDVAGISVVSASSSVETALLHARSYLVTINSFLTTMASVTNSASTLPPGISGVATLKASVSSALNETAAALTSVNTLISNIASQKIQVRQLNASLALAVAGPTQSDIDAQRSQVESAQADVENAQAALDNTVLAAPFAGTVTLQNGKVGQTVAANQAVASLMSAGGFEIEAYIAETDIASVKIGDTANVTLDAFGNEPFTAKVISIDPAETVIEGVSTYKVELAFVKAPPQLKSGMTANVDIITATARNVVAIPARAVAISGASSSVQVLLPDGSVETRQVTTGIRGADGSIEITSGLKAGDEVVTFTKQ